MSKWKTYDCNDYKNVEDLKNQVKKDNEEKYDHYKKEDCRLNTFRVFKSYGGMSKVLEKLG